MTETNDGTIAGQRQAGEETWYREYLEGPTQTRWSSLPPQTGDMAPDIALPDSDGVERRLSEWWSGGPLHLVFMRHFGCGCLADRWEELQDALGSITAAGATTVAVGQAEPERAAEVAARRGYGFPLLSDTERRAYAAYGLLDGTVASIFHDEAWRPDDRAKADRMTASRRGTERALVDHAWQLPGEFIIARGGRLAFTHRAQYCEDFPPTAVLLGALAALSA